MKTWSRWEAQPGNSLIPEMMVTFSMMMVMYSMMTAWINLLLTTPVDTPLTRTIMFLGNDCKQDHYQAEAKRTVLSISHVKVEDKKMPERQTKAGNQEFCKTCKTLSHSHTVSYSVSYSLTLDMLNNFCFHLYAQKSLSHSHALTLSHSRTLTLSHSFNVSFNHS